MKLKNRFSLFATLSLIVALASCKKDSDPAPPEEVNNDHIAMQANDASQSATEMDAAMADAALVIDGDFQFSSSDNVVLDYGPCDADITESDYESNPRTITITFNGETGCFSGAKSRTGKMVVTFPKLAEWAVPGSVATVKFVDFKVVRSDDEKSVTINGTQAYTNVSGGRLYDVYDGDTSVRTISSDNISVKIDSAEARTWHVARKYTTLQTENYDFETRISGTHTEGSVTGIAEWGINRFDKSFTTKIDAPIVISRQCNGRVTSGQITYTTTAYTASVQLGLDAQGASAGCPETGGYYFKLQATTSTNKTYSAILPY